MKRTLVLLSIAAGLFACNGQALHLDEQVIGRAEAGVTAIGADGAATGANGGGSACPPVPVGPPDADTASLAPLAGAWTGYIENFKFPSGADGIALNFSVRSDGSVAGNLVFGQMTPPAPPTDADAGYFPDGFGDNSGLSGDIAEGFGYSVASPSFDGTRLRFGVESREVFRPWCELQTSYLWFASNCEFGCLPDWPGHGDLTPSGSVTLVNPGGGPNLVVNPGKFSLCDYYTICDCGPSSCTVRLDQANVTFDVQVTPGRLDGSMLYTGLWNIHLTGPADGG